MPSVKHPVIAVHVCGDRNEQDVHIREGATRAELVAAHKTLADALQQVAIRIAQMADAQPLREKEAPGG